MQSHSTLPSTTSPAAADLAALVLRLALGTMFIAHGLLKVVVFTLPGTAAFFESQGFPGWSAYPVTALELVGGVALILGVYSRYVTLALIPVLLGALFVHLPNGWLFTAPNGGWEYPAFLCAVALTQALLGDGAYALVRAPTLRRASVVPNAPAH
ncbi:MAG: DoxX family protein [Proteobacteria bacterium]|nr:DoxX family protein [Burkholderiales bacterium]